MEKVRILHELVKLMKEQGLISEDVLKTYEKNKVVESMSIISDLRVKLIKFDNLITNK